MMDRSLVGLAFGCIICVRCIHGGTGNGRELYSEYTFLAKSYIISTECGCIQTLPAVEVKSKRRSKNGIDSP